MPSGRECRLEQFLGDEDPGQGAGAQQPDPGEAQTGRLSGACAPRTGGHRDQLGERQGQDQGTSQAGEWQIAVPGAGLLGAGAPTR